MGTHGHWIKGLESDDARWFRWVNGHGVCCQIEQYSGSTEPIPYDGDYYLVSAYTGPPLAVQPVPIHEDYWTHAGVEVRPCGDGVMITTTKKEA